MLVASTEEKKSKFVHTSPITFIPIWFVGAHTTAQGNTKSIPTQSSMSTDPLA